MDGAATTLEWRPEPQYWPREITEIPFINDSTFNLSLFNVSIDVTLEPHVLNPTLVITTTSFLILFCVVSLTVNIIIISSACFVKIMSTNLYFSLSLAAADTFSLFLYALGLVLFTLLPRGFGVKELKMPCFFLLIETLRMGAILTTIFHLGALAGNHYIGIQKPICSMKCSRSSVKCVAIILWTIPSTLLLIKVFYVETNPATGCSIEFLIKERFRMTFAIPLFVTLGSMMFIYCHIYTVVEKWKKTEHIEINCKTGSMSYRYQRRHQSKNSITTKKNKKAIVTTLMILGSVVIGWVPAFAYFVLVCEDCLFKQYWMRGTLQEHVFLVLINFLMISKTASNSYIYACRMKEIKRALHEMRRKSMSKIQ